MFRICEKKNFVITNVEVDYYSTIANPVIASRKRTVQLFNVLTWPILPAKKFVDNLCKLGVDVNRKKEGKTLVELALTSEICCREIADIVNILVSYGARLPKCFDAPKFNWDKYRNVRNRSYGYDNYCYSTCRHNFSLEMRFLSLTLRMSNSSDGKISSFSDAMRRLTSLGYRPTWLSDMESLVFHGQQKLCEEAKAIELRDVDSCKICYEHDANIVLTPCGHLLCAECESKIKNCPYCQSQFKSYRIYRS